MMLLSRILTWLTDAVSKLAGSEDRFDWDDNYQEDDLCHACDGHLLLSEGVFCRWCLACG